MQSKCKLSDTTLIPQKNVALTYELIGQKTTVSSFFAISLAPHFKTFILLRLLLLSLFGRVGLDISTRAK